MVTKLFELLKQIHKVQAELELKAKEEDRQLTFYEKFFTKNSCNSIKSLLNTNKLDLAIAIIMTDNPDLDFDSVTQIVSDNRTLFENENHQILSQLAITLTSLYNTGMYNTIKDKLKSNNKISAEELALEEVLTVLLFDNIVSVLNLDRQKFVPFMDLFVSYNKSVSNALVVSGVMNDIEEKYKRYMQALEMFEAEEGQKVPAKKQNKVFLEILEKDINPEALLKIIKRTRDYYENKKHEQKAKDRRYLKLQNAYSTLEKEIYQNITSGTEIKNIDKLLGQIEDASIRKQALEVIYLHNQKIYDKALEENRQLLANSKSRYQALLAQYGISPEDYAVGTIMNNSIEDVQTMLEYLTSMNIKSSSDILKILKSSNLDTISTYKELVDKGIITTDLLLNTKLFNPNQPVYKDFMHNLELIKKTKLNPYIFTAADVVLTTNHKTFEQGIDTLIDYYLLDRLKTGMNCRFLGTKNLDLAIDTLLELDLEPILEENIELLNYANRFERLRLLKAIDMPPSSEEEIKKALSAEHFFVADKEIGNYIYNSAQYNLPSNVILQKSDKKKNSDINRLEEYSATPRTYNIGGVTFSKNKTARNLASIASTGKVSDRLLYGLLKDTVLTEDELTQVASIIAPHKVLKTSKKQLHM